MPYFHKPPLFYWLTAISTSALGNNEWAARLPTLLSATGVTLGLFAFLRRWSNRAIALVALVVLVTMPLFFAGAQFANPTRLSQPVFRAQFFAQPMSSSAFDINVTRIASRWHWRMS